MNNLHNKRRGRALNLRFIFIYSFQVSLRHANIVQILFIERMHVLMDFCKLSYVKE